MALSTVGSVGADFLDFSAWETDKDGGTPGSEEVKMITDFSDSVNMQFWTSGSWTIRMHGDTQGPNRRLLTNDLVGGPAIKIDDTDFKNLTFEDFDIDGVDKSEDGININIKGTGIDNFRRMAIFNCDDGFSMTTASDDFDGRFENMLIHNCAGTGFFCNENASSGKVATHNFKNCGAFKNGVRGFFIRDTSLSEGFWFNCVAIDNTTEDWNTTLGNVVSAEVHECVSGDTSILDADYDVQDNIATGKSTTTDPVFVDFANDNFLKNESDLASWGISGDSANTPTLDLNGVTRTSNTIGPYDFAQSMLPLFIKNKQGGKMALTGGKQ